MSPSDFHQREKQRALRDQRIRRALLSVANQMRGNGIGGWVTARYLLDVLQASIVQETAPDSDDHAADLVRDLIGSSLMEERDDRELTSEAFRLDTWSVRVTPAATALLTFAAEPHPLVADPRRRK